MKHLVRVFLFNVFALWLTTELLPTLVVIGGWQTLLFAGCILSLLMLVIAPLLRILFIPINILTFGLLSWFVNVIVIYLLTVFVSEVQVHPWTFAGVTWAGFVIPPSHFSYLPALVISSLSITFISNILHSVSEG